ncbi:glycosyltransferase [Arenimonas sp.]|uniref:glycosyltransferase n=1 Tax=Arenimonas sp. TaxID=1872635 RepID=UPI0039C85AEE
MGNQWLALAYRLRHLRVVAGRVQASLRSRGLAGTWQRIRERRQARRGGPPAFAPPAADLRTRPLKLDAVATPRASIVIPAYGQLDYTLACLHALAACGDRTPFEVIVVDDASTDATPEVLPGVPGLRYLRNAGNLGFIGACNAGAAAARGEFLVFLNNDTTVQPGWLDALLDTFETHPDTGLAGSQLVYPDGRLQEAGGIVFADGSGWNYGRFGDPAHPRHGFVREVDYCSGASIALPRSLFEALGGFDPHYAPAYYEDTDLAMRVRAAGHRVRYQPASVVVHHEGVSSGTDPTQGVKQHQATNQVKFLARWREVLAATHAPPGTDPVLASERGRRHRVLVLDACTPHPDRDSGSVRMLALLRLLREAGCAVSFFNEDRSHDGDYTRALQQLGVEAWWTPYLADVPRWLKAEGHRFDLVIASRHYVLSPLLPLLRRHAPRARIVFDTVDLHYLREAREAGLAGDPARQAAAERTRGAELALVAACDATWVVSAAEKPLLEAAVPGARVEVVSNIHDVGERGAPHGQRHGLLFVGSYRHPPNVDAAHWLADEIFPRIRARRPGLELHLVGADAPADVAALGERDGIRFHGHVPDLGPLLASSRISLAPLRYGAGVKGKVNQALALGLPVVATHCAVEGMFLTDGVDVLVADEAEGFADAVLRLYDDATLWDALSRGGQENTRRHFSRDAVRRTLDALLASLPPR